jgi:hypothetical protein
MAEFINEEDESLEVGEELVDVNDGDEDTTDSIEEQPVVEEDKEELPEKYRGKSTAEIIQMHKEAEKLVGRQSSEVGDLRKIVDDFIQANLEKNSPQIEQDVEEVDFWSDPDKAFETKMRNNPELKQVKEISQQLKRQQVENLLNTEYPDWKDTIQESEFADWVRGSNVRSQLFADASNNYNWESASELLGTWRQLTKSKKVANDTMEADRKEQKRVASTGTSKASDSTPSKKIYRRSDIINLMQKNPDRYAQLSDEIMKAYSEGRVR